ncbi:MAG TPA: Asd/ArgC dimerization domain-containing protein [Terriglobales bacterium]|nr:Asd/ArgC dimerization domain-containing protein [Terriglobales bacterium]
MSSKLKSRILSHAEAPEGNNLFRVAIVGGATLKGKEIAEMLEARNFPFAGIKLLDDDESLGQLEAVGDEVTFIQKVRADEFRRLDVTFFASDPECTRNTWELARAEGSAIVDLSFALEDEPEATVRSPWIERQLGKPFIPEFEPGPSVVAHPAAVILGLLALRVHKALPLRQITATVFEPASEHGQKGLDELHEQTVNLLSFQPIPKTIFDTQVAFNLVAQYGERAGSALATVERRIVDHYRRIAGKHAPRLSLLLIQAPVFHGYALALHVETDQAVDVGLIGQALAGDHVNLVVGAENAPSNVNAAGQADVQVSVLPDAGQPKAFWLWAAADNLRIAAATAVECAENILISRPRGKIQ